VSRRKLSPLAQQIMDAFEADKIRTALANHNGNIAATARRLPRSYGWLRKRMKDPGINAAEFRAQVVS
jgi:DNA-binding NtrC family response regulator